MTAAGSRSLAAKASTAPRIIQARIAGPSSLARMRARPSIFFSSGTVRVKGTRRRRRQNESPPALTRGWWLPISHRWWVGSKVKWSWRMNRAVRASPPVRSFILASSKRASWLTSETTTRRRPARRATLGLVLLLADHEEGVGGGGRVVAEEDAQDVEEDGLAVLAGAVQERQDVEAGVAGGGVAGEALHEGGEFGVFAEGVGEEGLPAGCVGCEVG
jgi:hypothetical protein